MDGRAQRPCRTVAGFAQAEADLPVLLWLGVWGRRRAGRRRGGVVEAAADADPAWRVSAPGLRLDLGRGRQCLGAQLGGHVMCRSAAGRAGRSQAACPAPATSPELRDRGRPGRPGAAGRHQPRDHHVIGRPPALLPFSACPLVTLLGARVTSRHGAAVIERRLGRDERAPAVLQAPRPAAEVRRGALVPPRTALGRRAPRCQLWGILPGLSRLPSRVRYICLVFCLVLMVLTAERPLLSGTPFRSGARSGVGSIVEGLGGQLVILIYSSVDVRGPPDRRCRRQSSATLLAPNPSGELEGHV